MKYSGFILLIVLIVSSCNIGGRRVRGNGNVISKSYEFKDFSGVDVGSNMNIYLTQSNEYLVKIETDENLFNYIDVQVQDDNILDIDVKDNYNLDATGEVKVLISAPSIKKIDISGASKLQTEGRFQQEMPMSLSFSGASDGNISVKAPIIEMEASGASTLTVNGESRDIKVDASGASTINSFDLKSESAEIEASGASTIHVFSSLKLNAKSHGASSVKYRGNPQLTSDISGASSVEKD